MDIQRQINYWRDGSTEDLEAADVLLERKKIRHALFFAHLAVEKAIKAHVTRDTSSIPPKTHNLVRLAERTSLKISSHRMRLLRILNVYQSVGRYPEEAQVFISLEIARKDMASARKMVQWLIERL